MRVDTELLRRRIAARGKTKEAVANEIGVDYSTFARKMKCDGLAFSIGQMHKIVEILDLSAEDASRIFFAS